MAVRYRSGNHAIDANFQGAAVNAPDRRTLVYNAVRQQIDHDNKAPWSLSQKLNDAPYRYTRDTLWAALNSISEKLAASNPAIRFGVEDNFQHPTIKSFAEFVNAQLSQTVSALINGIMDASRWA